jgi:protein-S-isoprenylcysteine O-methyltransferase
MMRPLVFHDTTAEILFFSSVVLVHAIEFALRPRSRPRPGGSRDWSLTFIFTVLLAGAVGAALAAKSQVAPLPGGPWWPVIAGLTIMWTGFAFRAWTILTLGRFFQLAVIVQDRHKVVESGPYRWLRHPSYLGAIVLQGGIGMAEGHWTSIALMLAGGLTAFLVRIRVEERALLAALGEDYAAYARRTPRLLPRLF